MLGWVSAFDRERGLGVIDLDDGRSVTFHCTTIADGSRDIEEGTQVALALRPTHRGIVEGYAVVKLGMADDRRSDRAGGSYRC